MKIKESQIEDIFVTSPELLKTILKLDDDPKLLGRQIVIPSGRLDMLYAYKTELLLIELKIVAYRAKFIRQILDYKNDLFNFQQDGKLVNGEIVPFLVLPNIDKTDLRTVEKNGIKCCEYNPEDILKYFYNEKLKPITSFIELKPIDIGIWNIHLINLFIYDLQHTNSIKELQSIYKGSSKTLYNKIKFASELGLVIWMPNKDYIELSELGKEYVVSADKLFQTQISDKQIKLGSAYK